MAYFYTSIALDMRDLAYHDLLESEFTGPSGLNSYYDGDPDDVLIYGFGGYPYGHPPPLPGDIAIDDEALYFGVFTFTYGDFGDLEGFGGTVTGYSYHVDSISGSFSGSQIVSVGIGGFSVDVSQFRTLSDDDLTALICSGDDFISGSSGVDLLIGFAGDDVITGGGGADVLYGGDGSDTADYSTAVSGLYASLANPSINTGDAAGDEYHDIENLSGSDFADALNGDNAANVISGDDGNDTLKGYGGDDELRGGTGNDVLIGGTGADTLSGGLGSDTASYLGAVAGVYASLANASINTKDAKGDAYQSVENLTGSAYADRLNGSTLDNVIDGGAGNDMIKGYAGNDTLIGGEGDDAFIFNTALDDADNVDTIVDFTFTDDTIQLDDAIFTQVGPAGILQFGTFRSNTSGAAQAITDRIIYETDTGKLVYDADGTGSGAAIHFATLAPFLFLQNVDFVVI